VARAYPLTRLRATLRVLLGAPISNLKSKILKTEIDLEKQKGRTFLFIFNEKLYNLINKTYA